MSVHELRKRLKPTKVKILFVALIILIGGFIIAFSAQVPLIDEDYSLYARGDGFTQVIKRCASQYTMWNSRIGDVLSILFSTLPRILFNIINGAMIMVLISVIIFISRTIAANKNRFLSLKEPSALLATFLLLIFMGIKPNEVFFWRTGSANYFYPVLLILVYSLPLLWITLRGVNVFDKIKSAWLRYLAYFFYFLIGFIVGHANENTSPVVVGLFIVAIIIRLIKHNRPSLTLVLGSLGTMMGTYDLLFGASTRHRLQYYNSVYGNGSSYYDHLTHNLVPSLKTLLTLVAISAVLSIISGLLAAKIEWRRMIIVWLCFAAIGFSSGILLALAPYITQRAFFFSSLMFIFPIIINIYFAKPRFDLIIFISIAVVALAQSPKLLHEYQNIRLYHREKKQYIDKIHEGLQQNRPVFYIPQIPAHPSLLVYTGYPPQEAGRISQFFGYDQNAIQLK